MKSEPGSVKLAGEQGLSRRDFLKVGAGFSAALACASTLSALSGCGEAAKSPAKSYAFLRQSDLELFSALAPAVILDLAQLEAGARNARLGDVLQRLDSTCSVLDAANRQELRKLLDLLAIAPLRYALAGVGAWNEAGIETLQNFLARWQASRFATLNAGGNVLIKLVSTSYYLLPASWPASAYPGPLARMHEAVNT
jgi:hypothetical protein